jgi:hypothetical protein
MQGKNNNGKSPAKGLNTKKYPMGIQGHSETVAQPIRANV